MHTTKQGKCNVGAAGAAAGAAAARVGGVEDTFAVSHIHGGR